MTEEPAIPETRPPVSQRLSAVWLVPAIALIFSLWLVIQHYSSLGPLVTITFQSAEGIEAGLTPVRLRDVEVGKVKSVELDEHLEKVILTIRMNKAAENYLNQHSRFWIVKPRVGASGISGLSTLLSGAYIAMETRTSGEFQEQFTGLEEPPLTPDDAPGLHLKLVAKDGAAINIGAPVVHRQTQVGKVEGRQLVRDGQGVLFSIFVDAPYHELINSNTRFWDVSSFDIRMDASGLSIDTDPLPILFSGGIAFDTPRSLKQGTPVEDYQQFTLHSSSEGVLTAPTPSPDALGFVLHFDESIRGLEIGAPVEYRGVRIGHVADISIQHDPESGRLSLPILIFIEPLMLGTGTDPLEVHTLLDKAVENGLRAQLQTDSLLTGALFVDLTESTEPALAAIAPGTPFAEFPTTPSTFNQITAKASAVIDKLASLDIEGLVTSSNHLIDDLDALLRTPSDEELGDEALLRREQLASAPIQQLLTKVNHALDGLNPLLHDEKTRELPQSLGESVRQLNATLVSVRRILSGDTQHSPLYFELSATLKELTKAARAVRNLTQSLDEKPNALIFGNE